MNKQNNGLKAFFSVLMCIPLGFIIYFAVKYTSHNIPADEVISVLVTAGDQGIYNFTDESTREFYLNIYLDRIPEDQITAPPEGVVPAAVTCDRGDKRIDYSLYPSPESGEVLLKDENGHFYSLPDPVEQKIMVREEFQYLYTSKLLPSFSVVTGDSVQKVAPTKHNWNYIKADGNYYQDKNTQLYDGKSDLRIYSDRTNSIAFETQPDKIELTINNESVAPGSFSALNYAADTTLNVTVRATWDKKDNQNYGTAEYNFTVLYDIPARVYLSSTTCARGDTLLLRVDMLTDGETVELESDLITTAPEFQVQGDTAYAILPVDLANEVGDYELTFISGANKVTLTLNVTDKDYGFSSYRFTNQDFKSYLASDKMQELKSIMDSTVVNGGAMFFTFDSSFAHPAESGTLFESFGKTIILNDETAEETPYTGHMPGTIYTVKADTNVGAMQRGKVVYAGETAMTGKTVIVSHGMGIYTYYFNLESISVTVDTTIQKGTAVGKAGTSPLCPDDTGNIIHTAVSVGNVFVDADTFIQGKLFTE